MMTTIHKKQLRGIAMNVEKCVIDTIAFYTDLEREFKDALTDEEQNTLFEFAGDLERIWYDMLIFSEKGGK